MVFALPSCTVHDKVRLLAADNREIHQSAITKVTQVEQRDGAHWKAIITLALKERAAAEEWAAKLIRGINEPFYLSPPGSGVMLHEAATGMSPGAPLVKGASQVGTSLVTDGWTEDFVIKTGDWIETTANGISWLFKHIGDDVTATGASGDATLTIWPPAYHAASDNSSIRVSSPRAEMLLTTPEHEIDVDRFGIYRQSFNCFQWVR